jgi:hypothetical protein
MLQAYDYNTGAVIASTHGQMPELLGALGALGIYKGPNPQAAGGEFNCGTNICWPIGKSTETVWANLQRQVNRFATQGQFTKLPIDTFIGDDMVSAVAAVIRVTHSASSAAKAVAAASGYAAGRIEVARFASELEQEFRAAADAAGAPAGAGAIVGVAAGQATGTKPPVGSGYIPPGPAAKSKAIWWALGILSLAGIGTIGYLTYKRSKQSKPTKRTARVRAPAFAR